MQKTIYVPEENKDYWDFLKERAEEENESLSFLVNQAVQDFVEKDLEKN